MKKNYKKIKGTGYYDFGSFKLDVCDTGKVKRLHINLNRAKRPYKSINTYTLYESIQEKDKKYTELWIDKQSKQVVGISLMWDK